MNVLVTGGTGYIGSHTVVRLIESGHSVVIVDNLSNSKFEVVDRIERITGTRPIFSQTDLLDKDALAKVFETTDIDMVIHFAGFKAVGESVAMPMKYYQNNLTGTMNLLDVMQVRGVKRIVFSSSATVYDPSNRSPLQEGMSLGTTNPYGSTKWMIEHMMKDLQSSDSEWRIALLRYFNPIGAHESGWIGEDPRGIPNNLMPFITQVAIGKRPYLSVFGNDYPTPDGTGVRDYIHVVDLAEGHLRAMNRIAEFEGVHTYNLGTGMGYSVLDVVSSFKKATGIEIPCKIVERRPGDIAVYFADPSKACEELGWTARFGLEDMCRDAWKWQNQNPHGY